MEREPAAVAGDMKIYEGDSLEIMPELPAVDMVIADPPYSFGLASTMHEGKAGSWTDMMNASRWFADWLSLAREKLKHRDAALWCFNSWRTFPILAKAATDIRWPIVSLLVWGKNWIGPGGSVGLRPSYELVALFVTGEFAIENRGVADIKIVQWSSTRQTKHPAEKPVELIRFLLEITGGEPGKTVLDPFCGSGTTLVAAGELGMSGIGIEGNRRYIETAAERIRQGSLFPK